MIIEKEGYAKARASPMAQQVKNLPAMQDTQETWVQSLGQDVSLEKKMATTPVFLPGEFHGQKSLTGYSSWVSKGLEDLATKQ